jgi:predicted anti-sigma-YlaC factor YlaD
MSKAEFEGFPDNSECVTVHLKIYSMLGNLTPRNVDLTKSQINQHLKHCEPCRTFFKIKIAEKLALCEKGDR